MPTTTFSTGDTAWLMVSTAMVLLMTPGLAFFYGGMVRTQHVLVMLKMSLVCLSLVSILWLAVGYSLAFAPDIGAGMLGGTDYFFMRHIEPGSSQGSIPSTVYACFQLSFAVITAALISGSIAGRASMRGWVVFVVAWTLLVYVPIAHWVFAPDGWIHRDLHVLDFAGGLVVELNSGAAGLAAAIALRKRTDFERQEIRPHNLPLVIIGLALLWFGWFGFNAGSALETGGVASTAFLNTQLAACAAMIGWPLVERWRLGHVEMLGVASAAVAGMVAITPSCGEVSPLGAVCIGLAAGIVCAFAVNLKYRIGVDDTLDVVGVHGWGGIVGTLGIGLFATAAMSGVNGLFYGGGALQLGRQAVAVCACGAFSFVLTWLIAKAIDRTLGFRTDEEYQDVPGAAEERAYDDATVQQLRTRLGAPAAPESAVSQGTANVRLLAEIASLLDARERAK
jgi:Amt family ammonium transporter